VNIQDFFIRFVEAQERQAAALEALAASASGVVRTAIPDAGVPASEKKPAAAAPKPVVAEPVTLTAKPEAPKPEPKPETPKPEPKPKAEAPKPVAPDLTSPEYAAMVKLIIAKQAESREAIVGKLQSFGVSSAKILPPLHWAEMTAFLEAL